MYERTSALLYMCMRGSVQARAQTNWWKACALVRGCLRHRGRYAQTLARKHGGAHNTWLMMVITPRTLVCTRTHNKGKRNIGLSVSCRAHPRAYVR